MLKGFICMQCGNFFTTPPILITEHPNALVTEYDNEQDKVPVCSKECADGYERFMETVKFYESPTEQLELPFIAP